MRERTGDRREEHSGNIVRTTADGSRTLYSSRYRQAFHSRSGAVSEARLVYLEHSGIAARLERRTPSRILEVGFGTGLDYLLSADLALRSNTPLYYLALERELLPAERVAALRYHPFLQSNVLERYLAFRAALPELAPAGRYRHVCGAVVLELAIGDAADAELPERAFDAIYQDAFSPDANPELWTPEFLARLAAALDEGGRLVSYCVKGSVRRALQAAGLAVAKWPGPPGGKREVLVAARTQEQPTP